MFAVLVVQCSCCCRSKLWSFWH